MAKAHVVKMKDEQLGDVMLDINNGYVYDLDGNQLKQWEVTDQPYSKLLSDFAASEMLGVVASAAGSPVRFSGTPEEDRERAKSIRMRGWSDEESRLVEMDLSAGDVHLPAALSNYAAGYRNELPMADMFAPPLLVAKPSDKYFTFAKEDAFQRAMPTVGTTSAAVAEIAPRLANATFTTVEYALGGFVGTQLEAAADAPLRIRQATMARILNALLIEREIRVSALALLSTTWDSTVYTSLAVGAKWNGGVSSDPVKDIQDKMETSWGKPTGMLMSRKCYHAFVRNAQVQKYFTYKDGAPAMPDPSKLSALLQIPPIYVADMQYIKSDGTRDYIWGSSVVLFRQPPAVPPTSQDDVASALTFRWNASGNTLGQASGGMIVREFFEQNRGSLGGNKIVCVHQDAEVQTSKFVGGLIAGVIQ